MAKKSRKVGWYWISEDTLRGVFTTVVAIAVLAVAGLGYLEWQDRQRERLAVEQIERARTLLRVVEEEGGAELQRSTFAEAEAALVQAEVAWREDRMRIAQSRAEVSRSLLVSILDSLRSSNSSSEARFIYVEGAVELRRGETGVFRRARARDLLYEGDYVRSSNSGSAELLFGRRGSLFTVRPATLLKIQRTEATEEQPQAVGISYGWVDLSTSGARAGLQTRFAQMTLENDSNGGVSLREASDSGRFRVDRGRGVLESASTGQVVRVAALEEVVAGEDGFGSRLSLPAPPTLEGPPDNLGVDLDKIQEVQLAWQPAGGDAQGYALEISRSRLFSDTLIQDGRKATSARVGLLGEGNFYWRVAARSGSGQLGPWSPAQSFRVASMGGIGWEDAEPPVLVVDEVYVNGRILLVTGRTEPGVRLEIAGQSASVGSDGTFKASVAPRGEGLLSVTIAATDAAGNRSETRREVLLEDL